MSSNGEDKLKIPIEIKTEDLDEIRELINEITQAESDLHTLKATPRKGRGAGDTSSRSAFTEPIAPETRGGIFGGQTGEAKPIQPKDKKSQTPVQRENEFAKLKNQVQEQEQRVSGLQGLQQGLGTGLQAAVNVSTSNDAGGFILGSLGKFASKAFLPLSIITTIVGVVSTAIDKLFSPGGPLDIRFKRDLATEISSATEREEKQKIRQSLKYIRITSYGGQRAQAYSGNGEAFRAGIPTHDIGIESRAKGLPW